MRLLLNCNSSDEHYSADVDHAYVNLTPEYAKELVGYVDLFRTWHADMPDLCWAYFFDGRVIFFSDSDELDLDFHELVEAPEDFDIDQMGDPRVEGEMVCVDETGVHWKGYPKHSSITIETTRIYYDKLKQIAKGEPCTFVEPVEATTSSTPTG